MKNTMKRMLSGLLSLVMLLSLMSGINLSIATTAQAAGAYTEELADEPWFYLSDFPPMEEVTTGWTGSANYLSINSSLGSGDLADLYLCTEKVTSAANAVKFEKGMSIHAVGKIAYDISDMGATRFTCLFGAHAKHPSVKASVGLKIYTDLNADGEYLYCLNSAEDAARLGVESFPLGQYDKAVEVDIAIPEGATRLYFEVTNGGNGGDSDFAVFAEPKLYAEFLYLSNMEYVEFSSRYNDILYDKSRSGPITFNTLYKGSANGGMTMKEVTCDEGLGLHAPSSITYNIEGLGVKRFTAFCGISTNNGNYNPTTNFKVLFDGVEAFSVDKKKSEANIAIDGNVDLQVPEDTKTITLTATAVGSNSGNHACWAYPRLFVDSLARVHDYSLAIEHENLYLNVAQEITVIGKSMRGERNLDPAEVKITAASDNVSVDGNKITATSGETAVLKVELIEDSAVVLSKTFELDIVGEHTHNYTAVVTPPTCMTNGYTAQICTICDAVDSVSDYVEPIAHSFDAATGSCIYGCGTEVTYVAGIYADGELVAPYTSVNEAITAYESGIIKLYQNSDEAIVIAADLVIDLAGYSLSDVTVSKGSLKLIDSAASYEVNTGSATVTGTVEAFTEAGGKSYLVAEENGVYSAHPYDVELTHISLDPSNDALGYKAKLYGDAVVQAQVESFGFHMWLDGYNAKTYGKTGTDVLTLRLKNIFKNQGQEMNINATAFVSFGGHTKTTQQHTTTMKQTLQLVDSAWTAYSEAQQTAVKSLCTQYFDTVKAWEIPNIMEALMPSATVEEIEVVDQAMTVYGGAEATFTLTGATTFTTQDTAETVPQSPYADWIADYYVSMDKPAAEGLYLAGNYGAYGWIAIPVEAGRTYAAVPVVTTLLSTSLTYEEVVTQVGTFRCGVADTAGANAGAIVTVELRLTNPEDPAEYITLNMTEHTIPAEEIVAAA